MQAKFYYLQSHALAMLSKAIRHGDLIPASQCEKCGLSRERALHGHHEDYSKPLEVIWLCDSCHRKEHNRDGAYSRHRMAGKLTRVLQWLKEHPEHINTKSRKLAAMLEVSHITVWKAQQIVKADNGYTNGLAQ